MILKSKDIKDEAQAQRELTQAEAAVKQAERDLATAKILHAHKLAAAMAIRSDREQAARKANEPISTI